MAFERLGQLWRFAKYGLPLARLRPESTRTIADVIEEQAAARGPHPFILFEDRRTSYDEFNRAAGSMRIDRWRGLRHGRPFPEAAWLDRMYLAHDLEAITNFEIRPRRPARVWGSKPLE